MKRTSINKPYVFAVCLTAFFTTPIALAEPFVPEAATGFGGVWYSIHPTGDEYSYKYSGGMGTFPQVILPMAQYSPEVNKTFFVWGGADDDNQLEQHVAFFDHSTRQVSKPRILRRYTTNDAHDTASITIAPDGHLWVFSTVHGNDSSRKGEIYRSDKPHSIDHWNKIEVPAELDAGGILNYTQPWQVPGEGMLLLFTRYTKGRQRYFSTTRDNGLTWAPRTKLSELPGHYQISWQRGNRIGCAFDRHPERNVDERTDLYYTFTDDFGKSWTNANGQRVAIPIVSTVNEALVRAYSKEDRLVYLKDLKFDAEGNPAILYVTSLGHKPGPQNAPRQWIVAHWTNKAWKFHEITQSDHNYDHGSLYLEPDGTWRVIGPTEPGPQPNHTGGEMAMWTSSDQGTSWSKHALTANSSNNHSYVRCPLNAHPDFYAFWTDGDARQRSKSSLYFCNQRGDVFRLPRKMDDEMSRPELVPPPMKP